MLNRLQPRCFSQPTFAGLALTALLALTRPNAGGAQVQVWHIGRGGLSWTSQALTQSGALDIGGGLQPLELAPNESLIELLRASGQPWLNGQPRDFTLVGQPRTWSNDGLFNQINGPLMLVDGDATTSSKGTFKTARSQAGAEFIWDLGAPYPIDRVRFFPDPNDPDAFVKSFEVLVNDGEDFSDIRRPIYTLLRRVEANKDQVVDLRFATLQGRFVLLRVLSKSSFNLAEFQIYGEGFVPVSSYVSQLHSFGGAVNYGRLRIHATRLGRVGAEAETAPTAAVQMRTGADDTPLAYFRRDRDTGSQEEVTAAEYNANLPRRALYRQDPVTGALLEEVERAAYLALPVAQQGPVRDYVQGDTRQDAANWSAWSPPLAIAATGTLEVPVSLPSPREFMQFRVTFDGDPENAIRIDTLQVEYSPGLVSAAVGEMALEDDPAPATGVLQVEGGIDTAFIYDIRARFDRAGLDGFQGVRVEAFPPPVFERLEMGEPLAEVRDLRVEATAAGFNLHFAPVGRQNNQPIRVHFRLRVLEHNTPVNAWLLGSADVPPHPVEAGDASEAVSTGVTSVFALQSEPVIEARLSTAVITPNGDGANESTTIQLILSQFAAAVDVDISIFDLGGRRVRQLVVAPRSSGAYGDTWDGRDRSGHLVPPGLYLCRAAVTADSQTFDRVQLIGVLY